MTATVAAPATVPCLVVNTFNDMRISDRPKKRAIGDFIMLEKEKVPRWEEMKLVTPVPSSVPETLSQHWPWGVWDRRDLRPYPPEPGKWRRIVACLNIWNDHADLLRTWNLWYPYVDHVIVVDGAYRGSPVKVPWSTDGTLSWLSLFRNVEIVKTETFWESQHLKRTEYFKRGQDGDLLIRIDADEFLYGAQNLAALPDFDVGWVPMISPLYKRPQSLPIAYKWRPELSYQGRHHWVYEGDRLVTTAQRGGVGYDHTILPLVLDNRKGISRSPERKRASSVQRTTVQAVQERAAGPERQRGIEPLRIVQISDIDPGLVIYRLHSAINTTSPHDSILIRSGEETYQKEPRFLDAKKDRELARAIVATADVVHCHLHYHTFRSLGIATRAEIVIHHHGTMLRAAPEKNAHSDRNNGAALRLVANFELLTHAPDAQYLPNPVPVAQYRKLSEKLRRHDGVFRVAHSPTKRGLKGTEGFLRVIDSLRRKGLKVEAVLLEGLTHAQVLEKKAECDATFDSFWLGLQCSGLEAGAMATPVLAGDAEVLEKYLAVYGECPYTFVEDVKALESTLERLIVDKNFYLAEASRIYSHVLHEHDYGAVTEKYLDLLDDAISWRDKLSI